MMVKSLVKVMVKSVAKFRPAKRTRSSAFRRFRLGKPPRRLALRGGQKVPQGDLMVKRLTTREGRKAPQGGRRVPPRPGSRRLVSSLIPLTDYSQVDILVQTRQLWREKGGLGCFKEGRYKAT